MDEEERQLYRSLYLKLSSLSASVRRLDDYLTKRALTSDDSSKSVWLGEATSELAYLVMVAIADWQFVFPSSLLTSDVTTIQTLIRLYRDVSLSLESQPPLPTLPPIRPIPPKK
jgi:hypothetical protein